MQDFIWLIPLLPLAGFLVNGLGYRRLPKSVVTAEVNGNQVYRLRANAGGEASAICGKLKVAGENCLIVN